MLKQHGSKRHSVRYNRVMGTFHSALLLVPFVVEATGALQMPLQLRRRTPTISPCLGTGGHQHGVD